MAEDAATAPVAEAPAPVVPAATEPAPAADTNGDAADPPKEDGEAADQPAATEASAANGSETTLPSTAAHTAPAEALPEAPLPSSDKKEKRKSTGGVPEHKNKKLNKKKSMPSLHLDCKPGQYFWAKLKGYPAWPSILCDEQMLPESLLASRPVSTARPDGSIRDDFKEGGKNAKERTFPVMFLATNEFTWIANTNLEPLDPEQCKEKPKAKMVKDLSDAWQIASEGHDLAYFKEILKLWQEEEARFEKEAREEEERWAKEAEERAAEEVKKAADGEAQEKKPKKARKSKGGDGDVDMVDADGTKSAKKRKKEAESDAEGKPKKTPKVTKLNAPKTPNGESSTKKSAAKSKKKVVQAPPKAEETEEKEQLTEAQELERREKAILYLRHRLQKGFLSSSAPQGADLEAMAGFFAQLEGHTDLEPSIIRTTKVHKVLKAIIKLSSIPKDEEYNWKLRSAALLEIWNKRMEADQSAGPASATEAKAPATLGGNDKEESSAPATNGDAAPGASSDAVASEMTKIEDEAKGEAKEEEAVVEKKAEEAVDALDMKAEEAVKAEEKTIAAAPAKSEATDIEMGEAAAVEEPVAGKTETT